MYHIEKKCDLEVYLYVWGGVTIKQSTYQLGLLFTVVSAVGSIGRGARVTSPENGLMVAQTGVNSLLAEDCCCRGKVRGGLEDPSSATSARPARSPLVGRRILRLEAVQAH